MFVNGRGFRFVILLMLLLALAGCSVLDDILLKIPKDPIDDAARRVADTVDIGMAQSFSSSGDELATEYRVWLRSVIIGTACETMVDGLKEGEISLDDIKEQATSNILSQFAGELGGEEAGYATGIMLSAMDAIEEGSDGDPTQADRICRNVN